MTKFVGTADNGEAVIYTDKKRHLYWMVLISPIVSLASIWLYFALGNNPIVTLIPALFFYGFAPLMDAIMGEDPHNPPEEVVDAMMVHQLLETGTGILPLILMGMPASIAALLGLAVATQLILQHSNVDMKIGKLRYIWAIAPLHRFHHQNSAKLGNVNFGLLFVFWDMLLGTYVYDANQKFSSEDLGIDDSPSTPLHIGGN